MESRIAQSKKKLFSENPYDLDVFFESLYIAEKVQKEHEFLDKLFTRFRKNPQIEITTLCFETIRDMKLIELK